MRYLKNILFFVFIIISFIALWINIIVVTSNKTPKLAVLDSVNAIYFDESKADTQTLDKIKNVINSNNTAIFSQLVDSKNPINEFYGFCGLMKGNQKTAIKYLGDLLISTKKVTIYIDGEKIESNLGYAILLLINDFPENLTNPPIEDFYSISEKSLSKAYQSQLVSMNEEYKLKITELISNKYPDIKLNTVIVSNTTTTNTTTNISYDNVKSLSNDEKIKISSNLPNIPLDKREKVIIDLLGEKDTKIIQNVVKDLTEKDSKVIGNFLYTILNTQISQDLSILLVKKYALILKSESIPNIQTYMKKYSTNETILTVCLEQIYNYGNASSYEFLKLFLETNYTVDLNLIALKTIVQTTYKTSPSSVLKTLMFVIKYLNQEPLANYSIKFCITNSVSEGSTSIILPRLMKKESAGMKLLAIEYIDKFRLKEGLSLIQELSGDNDTNIQQKAKELETKLNSL